MAKQNEKVVKEKKVVREKTENKNNDSYEKLRDELFEYRVEIKSFKNSMKTLWTSVTVILALLTFFGYNHIETLLDKVESNANDRLATTDALLAKVNTDILDSLMIEVEKKTAAYSEAITALENGTRVNNELYRKLIDGLPFNDELENRYDPYVIENPNGLFDIVYYSDSYSKGQKGECYVVMGEGYIKENEDVFLVIVEPKGKNKAIYYQYFEVQKNYNKLWFEFAKNDDDIDYELNVILLRERMDHNHGYKLIKRVSLK